MYNIPLDVQNLFDQSLIKRHKVNFNVLLIQIAIKLQSHVINFVHVLIYPRNKLPRDLEVNLNFNWKSIWVL